MCQRRVSCLFWLQVLPPPGLSFQVGCEGKVLEVQAGEEGGLVDEQEFGLVEMLGHWQERAGAGFAPDQCQLSSPLISLS